jgi:error-prone DNA polymerase
LTGNRHQAAWQLAGVETGRPLLDEVPPSEATPLLRVPTEGQNIVADYGSVGLTLRRHPLALLRETFQRRQILAARELKDTPTDQHVRVAGLVLFRQSPGTAHDTTFITLEDETGQVQLIVWSRVSQLYRKPFLQASLLEVGGRLQHEKGVTHVIAEDLVDRSRWLGSLRAPSRDFR